MSDLRKAAQQALEHGSFPQGSGILHDLRVALAQPEQEPLSDGEIYTAYITATNQTLRPQDERLAFEFARAIEKAHGIGGEA